MSVTWSMKQKINDIWEPISLNSIAGKTLRESLQWMTEQEIVAEFIINGANYYFCGTEHWRKRMERKGKAVLASEAIELLTKIHPALLEEICPLVGVENTFPGSQMEMISR